MEAAEEGVDWVRQVEGFEAQVGKEDANFASSEVPFSPQGFIDSEYIRLRGPLTEENALEYFARGPYFESECNNEVVRARNLEPEMVRFLRGVEYRVVATSDPLLLVIIKQFRYTEVLVKRLRVFFVMNGLIVEAQSLQEMVSARLANCSFHLNHAFQFLHKQTQKRRRRNPATDQVSSLIRTIPDTFS